MSYPNASGGLGVLSGVSVSIEDGETVAIIGPSGSGKTTLHLVPSLTALGNVMLPIEIAGRDNARALAHAMLDRVGLADREDHYPSQLSGGEQQRVAIARALVHSPRLLLADEPTGNLDLQTGEKIIELLFSLNKETGSTMVLVTHDNEIAKRCQRIFRLNEGKLHEVERQTLSA